MKKVIFYVASLILFTTSLVLAQVPASQDTIWIPGGQDNIGSLENTINGDTVLGGGRINPNRVYGLLGNTIYYAQAPFSFGVAADSNATCEIYGQAIAGESLPVILQVPVSSTGNSFTDQINANFKVSNVYWEAISLVNNNKSDIFGVGRIGRRLTMTNVITQYGGNNLFGFQNHGGELYLYNCYFRDMNWFQDSWNSTIYSNSGMDTAWIENCTMTHSGLGYYFNNTVNFMYFNHNTIVDETKYGVTHVQYNKAFFANNVFVNVNFEGECSGTEYTQNDAHVFLGCANIDSTTGSTQESTLWQTEQGYVPTQTAVQYLNSNNIWYTDTALNQYYTGKFNTAAQIAAGFTVPASNRNWAPASWLADSTIIKVQNIPPMFINSFTQNLANAYPNIVLDKATISYADPQLVTPAIHNEKALEELVYYAESDYGTAPTGQVYDPAYFTFGNYNNPDTATGKNGQWITQISDLPENFSYASNVRSTIDFKPLGALTWWPSGLSGWDSQAEYQKVVAYYKTLYTGVKLANNTLPAKYNLAQNYPNPFNPSTIINYSIPQSGNVTLRIYNILGQEVATVFQGFQKAGSYNANFDASRLASGTYFYRLQSGQFNETKKMLYIK
jgi:hypothetical protein